MSEMAKVEMAKVEDVYTFKHDLRLLMGNDVYRPERYASFKTIVNQYRDDKTKVILPGDLLGASRYAVAHKGESILELLNNVGVDYCTLGNHEFDFGYKRLDELIKMSDNFKWLGSNVRYSESHEQAKERQGDIFSETVDMDTFEIDTKNAGVVKVGVFGVCTAGTPLLSSPGDGVVFEDVFEHGRRCVEALQSQGCELILAFTHLSLAQDKELVEKVPGINVILGGHDHDPYLIVHRSCLIVKCGLNIDHLEKDELSGLVHVEHSFQLLSTKYVKPDAGMLAIMDKWRKATLKTKDDDDVVATVANTGVALSTKTQSLRAHENSFGCLVADAIKWGFEHGLHADGEREGVKCDIGIQNGGFIRGDHSYLPNTDLTVEVIREEMPFNRAPFLLNMRGDMLKQGIEEMLKDAPAAAGSFPHFSSGVEIVYEPRGPKFNKIKSFKINNELVVDSQEYTVGISQNYVDRPCDDVHSFNTNSVTLFKIDLLIREVVVKYLKATYQSTGVYIDASLPRRLIDDSSR